MSTQRRLRRGTKAESDAFTGSDGETVYETDNERLINHNGVRAGGFPVPNFLDIINHYFEAATATGTDTIAVTLPYAPTAYTTYMEVLFKPANNNTGAATLNVNSLGAKNIYKDNGAGTLVALAAADLKANIPVKCIYDGTQFVAQLGGSSSIDVQTFTSSGTWNKPSKGSYAFVLAWGAGGSGGRSTTNTGGGGGGGGAYVQQIIALSALASSVTVTIGAGGAAITSGVVDGNAGGDSTFGTHVTAYGGGGGGASGTNSGGGGGGALGKGGQGEAGAGTIPSTIAELLKRFNAQDFASNGGAWGGAPYGGCGAVIGSALLAGQSVHGGGGGGALNNATYGVGGNSFYGGGGGGGGGNTTVIGGAGGNSIYGGAGGGGGAGDSSPGNGAGGTSKFGGAGGAGSFDTNVAVSGTQPGGGGGGSEVANSGAGGNGQIVVFVV